MANYVLSEELRRLVQQVVGEHKASFQPRPKRGRRVRGHGGGQTQIVGKAYTAHITEAIHAGSAAAPYLGRGIVYRFDESGDTVEIGEQNLYNPFPIEVSGSVTCFPLRDEYFMILGIAPYGCETKAVVTNVACETDPQSGVARIAVSKEDITYLHGPCPA